MAEYIWIEVCFARKMLLENCSFFASDSLLNHIFVFGIRRKSSLKKSKQQKKLHFVSAVEGKKVERAMLVVAQWCCILILSSSLLILGPGHWIDVCILILSPSFLHIWSHPLRSSFDSNLLPSSFICSSHCHSPRLLNCVPKHLIFTPNPLISSWSSRGQLYDDDPLVPFPFSEYFNCICWPLIPLKSIKIQFPELESHLLNENQSMAVFLNVQIFSLKWSHLKIRQANFSVCKLPECLTEAAVLSRALYL